MDQNKFDQLFDEAWEEGLEESYARIEIPNPDASWQRMREKMARAKRRRDRRRRWQLIATAVASLLIGSVVFGSPVITKAFQPLNQIVESWKGTVLTFINREGDQDTSGAKTAPPPDTASENKPKYPNAPGTGGLVKKGDMKVSMEEAKRRTLFPMLEPQLVLDGYTQDNIQLSVDEEGRAMQASITYKKPTGEFYLVEQNLLEPNTIMSMGIDEENDTVSEVEALGIKGKLISNKANGIQFLILLGKESVIKVYGKISQEDAIRVANHLK
ncbi:hypothetical protein J31TS4_45400 [Paenibacillus sp. J31TS4]|uniref:DUF4367 domain-containing protein n=1 Tax=Paenibacillus sp. J31TS4 TaxID=2807195 RepID=UPI001B1A1542|nr:DUF4367 domain-containing protein [Paenibacillus sp. J31TS4]GIP41260.1 hypothetical protein J31TS4_45400 [Paenibacillus sp. J31TS4]